MTVRIPGARDVRATLDESDDSGCPLVVACPPHPQMGGNRRDGRLRAVSDELTARGIDCLRIDYGPWDGGVGEVIDVQNALSWAQERTENQERAARVGLFGYSFGATIAVLAAGDRQEPDALSVLAPGSHVLEDQNPVDALDSIHCPVQLIYGTRDDVVDAEPLVELANGQNRSVESVDADHFFVGQQAAIAARVAEFFERTLLV